MAFNIISQAITIPFIKKPFQDLSHPYQGYAIKNAMNVRIKVGPREKGEEIGGWFLQPIGNTLSMFYTQRFFIWFNFWKNISNKWLKKTYKPTAHMFFPKKVSEKAKITVNLRSL